MRKLLVTMFLMVAVFVQGNVRLLDTKISVSFQTGKCDAIQERIIYITGHVHNINKYFIPLIYNQTNRVKMFHNINIVSKMVNKWIIDELYRGLVNYARRDGGRIVLHKGLLEPLRILIVNTRTQVRFLEALIITKSRHDSDLRYKIISLNEQTKRNTIIFIKRLKKMKLILKITKLKK